MSVADAPNLAGTEDGTWQNYEYERYSPRRVNKIIAQASHGRVLEKICQEV